MVLRRLIAVATLTFACGGQDTSEEMAAGVTERSGLTADLAFESGCLADCCRESEYDGYCQLALGEEYPNGWGCPAEVGAEERDVLGRYCRRSSLANGTSRWCCP